MMKEIKVREEIVMEVLCSLLWSLKAFHFLLWSLKVLFFSLPRRRRGTDLMPGTPVANTHTTTHTPASLSLSLSLCKHTHHIHLPLVLSPNHCLQSQLWHRSDAAEGWSLPILPASESSSRQIIACEVSYGTDLMPVCV
jgi:hypothetical protein